MFRRTVFLCILVTLWAMACPAFGQLDPDLVGWWTFDEGSGTIAYDYSRQVNNGTFVDNDPLWVPGVMGGALSFSGDNEQLELTTILPVGTTSSTFALWIKVPLAGTEGLDASERVGDILGNYNSSPNSNWELHAGGQMRFWWNGGQLDYRGATDLRDDTWHHVVWTRDRDASTISMFIDGQLEASFGGVGTDIDFTTTHRIGGDNRGDPPSFHGLMDDLQLYTRALSLDEVLTIMSGPVDYRMISAAQPFDGQVDVLRDVVLSWTPGLYAATHDVYLGTNFFDVNEASRTNPLGVLVSQGQSTASYDPPIVLDFEQTYYWRIDEVNAAPDNTIFKGAVRSFTVEPFSYVIEEVLATSNLVSTAGQEPENTVNGSGLNAEGEHATDQNGMWTAKVDSDEPEIIQFQFDRIYKMYEMHVWNHNLGFEALLGLGLKDVTIEYSVDGIDWTVLKDVELPQASGQVDYTGSVISLDGIAAKFIRLVINSAWLSTTQLGLAEVRFTYIAAHAREPQPQDGATNVSPDAILAWRCGRDAASHDVYLGTDLDALEIVDSTTQSLYDPAGLDLGTTYAWRIDEVNEANPITTWPGDVWTFSTLESLLVDGFDDYTDDIEAGETIWQTWLDGLTDPKYGGSQVGYDVSPFAEKTIVRSGRQSMPIKYANTASRPYSEAERIFDTAQDWTAFGIKTLSLYFRGETNNGGQLYVKINDTKVPYDGDAANVAKTVWQPWNIDLTALGGAANVQRMTIGIEGANASGILYIDDIRLHAHPVEFITPAEPDSANRLHWWTFDEGSGTVAHDASGNGNDATVDSGELLWVPGVVDGALEFDGVRHQLTLTSPLTVGSSSNALAAWIKVPLAETGNLEAGERVGNVLGNYPDVPNTNWELHDDGQMRLHWNGGEVNAYGTTDLRDDTWHHVAWVRDKAADTCYMYIDGLLEATHASAGTDIVFGTNHAIGGDSRGATAPHFHGLMDDLQLYNAALSAGEIAWLAGLRMPIHTSF